MHITGPRDQKTPRNQVSFLSIALYTLIGFTVINGKITESNIIAIKHINA